MELIIPEGWRLLKIGEITQLGDKYYNDFGGWSDCWATVNRLVQDRGPAMDAFIRLDTGPAPEKEWLNAWN